MRKTPIRLVYFLAIDAEPMHLGHRNPDSCRIWTFISAVPTPPFLESPLFFIKVHLYFWQSDDPIFVLSPFEISIGHFDSLVDKGLVHGTFNEGCAHGVPAVLSSPVFLTFLEIGSKLVSVSMVVGIIRPEAT